MLFVRVPDIFLYLGAREDFPQGLTVRVRFFLFFSPSLLFCFNLPRHLLRISVLADV